MINYEKALVLLQVAEKARGYTNLKWLVEAADAALADMAPKAAPDPVPAKPEPKPQLEVRKL